MRLRTSRGALVHCIGVVFATAAVADGADGCVLMPAFDDAADAPARDIIASCFPDREIIAIDSRALIRQHGGLHCAAMQIPAESGHE